MGVIVREAMQSDFAALRMLVHEFVELSVHKSEFKLHGDTDYLLNSLRAFVAAPNMAVMLLVHTGDHAGPTPIGFMGLVAHAWSASPANNFCSENLWYIYPAFARHLRLLLRGANDWAKDQNCDYFTMSANRLVGADVKRLERIFEKLGMKPLYQLYVQEVT